MICQPFDHDYVQGAKPMTYGEQQVTFCAKCGLIAPWSGSGFASVMQLTFPSVQRLSVAPVASQEASR